MSQFLATEEHPEGFKLEEVLAVIRKDVLTRATKIVDDERPEAKLVLENTLQVIQLLSESIRLAEESSQILNRSFGPHQQGTPRIGIA